jgi:hypothetical protein
MQRLREEVACVLADKDIVTVPNPGAAVLKGELQLEGSRAKCLGHPKEGLAELARPHGQKN